MHILALLQEGGGGGAGAAIGGLIMMLIWLAVMVFFIAVGWKIFAKAGQPGWASIIPIYNLWILVKIIGKPTNWFIFMLIPGLNVIFGILAVLELAKVFGKSTGFGIGLLILGFIFAPILAFGSAQYQGAASPA